MLQQAAINPITITKKLKISSKKLKNQMEITEPSRNYRTEK